MSGSLEIVEAAAERELSEEMNSQYVLRPDGPHNVRRRLMEGVLKVY